MSCTSYNSFGHTVDGHDAGSQESGVCKRQERPRWAKVVFGDYRPNRWFTEEQLINKRSSQTQMASDQRGRGSDARRAGAQAVGRRDRGAVWHQGPRPREIKWAQHWRAEFNPYRTKGRGPSDL
ncbi:hypothetical protein SKAU_G00336340 [Synaphobranchus kaupii]|uniref:Uncharacterized protein n=1 Tax=Synaphobranchus kaupii TaxID=118154 RepID=A0A9Q1EM64_SYNKA|nr:hypothetical protein SKAU_G00336340 [Synaphobranchus kaupii]